MYGMSRLEGKQMVIKPTIGRVMWLRDASLSSQFSAAMVVFVHSDSMVNLVAFDRNGEPHQRTSIFVHQGDPESCPPYQACWMPYQKAQAQKDATETALQISNATAR